MSADLFSLHNLDAVLPDGRTLYQDVSLEVVPGDLFQILGPNGSGKTTLLRQILNKLQLQSATNYSYLPQMVSFDLPLPLTLQDVIEFECPEVKPDEIIKCGLLNSRDLALRWSEASGGEKKKALITRALLSQKDILILDEPFNHLDKKSLRFVKSIFVDYLSQGVVKSIIMVTHTPIEQEFAKNTQLKEIILDY